MKNKFPYALMLAALIFSLLLPVTTARAAAATLTVTDTSDSNDGLCNAQCSLREAVGLAANGDSVVFAPGVTGTITLTSSSIFIGTSITITGPGISQLTIDGNNAYRIFYIGDAPLIVSISGMTITQGSNDQGGAIYNTGTLNIDSVDFTNNHVHGDYTTGGAIFNGKTLTINNSSFSANSADSKGGAVASYYGTTLTVTNTIFDNNHASGAIAQPYSEGGAISVLSDSAVNNQSHISLDHVTVKNNSAINNGGGIFIQDGAIVTISHSAFSGNSITNAANGVGGGFYFGGNGSAAFDNVTISGNSAGNYGGGIYSGNYTFNMNNVTIADNAVTSPSGYGGGIHMAGVFNIKNSIIANNTAATGNDCNVSGTFNSQGNNLVEDTTTCFIIGDTSGNITGVDPNLGALSDHGGNTLALPLLTGSPAIDKGNDATCMATDQRGFPRPQGAHCDMGAFEFGAASWVITKLADTNDNVCDNDCSLREAVALALDGDKINFATGLSGTITLNNAFGYLGLNNSVTITGPGADVLTISGNDLIRAFVVSQDMVVRISGLTITHGYISEDSGGGILNDGGILTLDHVVVSNSQAVAVDPTLGNGGGIASYGTLTITNSKILTNHAQNHGGGIYNVSGSNISLTDTVIDSNSSASGGGIYFPNAGASSSGTVSLKRVSVTSNIATVQGAGIYLSDSAVISDSLIAKNTASNGLGVGAGGGMSITEAGGSDDPITVTLTNVTISGNSAYGQGGGINVSLQNAADAVTLNYVTIADNHRTVAPGAPVVNGGGGIYASGTKYMDIKNSIVAGNTTVIGGADCEGRLNSLDHNLIQDTNNCATYGVTTHNIIGLNAKLGTLTNNGGTTPTMKLLIGSPAIDSADNAACPAADQRGFKRPQGARCDMGAFESYIISISPSIAANDGWTLESSEFSNVASTKSNSGTLRVGDDAKNKQYRSLLYFDTASLPNNAVITKATLQIKMAGSVIGDIALLGDLVADMKKGFFGLAPLELADFNAAGAPINTAGKLSEIGSNWYQLTLSPANFKYVNLTGVTQFRLRFLKDDNNNKTADFMTFYAGEDGTNPPQLIVEYTVP